MRKASLLFLFAIAIIVVLLIGRFDFSEADFSTQNPAWNGLTQFSGNYTLQYLPAMSDLSSMSDNTTLLIIGPTKNFTPEESDQALKFMQRGGKVIVMDDFGTSNSLLYGIGSPITLYQEPLRDHDHFYYRQYYPVITNISQTGLTSGVYELILNHPASLNVTGNVTILATSSTMSWMDGDDDLFMSATEHYAQHPIIASTQYDRGELIVASDPDLIVNVMMDKSNNSVLASNIAKTGNLYLDISHSQGLPPLVRVFYVVRYDLVAQLLCALLLAVIAYAVYQRVKIKRLILGPEVKQSAPVDRKQSIIDFIRAKLPAKEHEIKELNRKL